jgi:hypothetical protein
MKKKILSLVFLLLLHVAVYAGQGPTLRFQFATTNDPAVLSNLICNIAALCGSGGGVVYITTNAAGGISNAYGPVQIDGQLRVTGFITNDTIVPGSFVVADANSALRSGIPMRGLTITNGIMYGPILSDYLTNNDTRDVVFSNSVSVMGISYPVPVAGIAVDGSASFGNGGFNIYGDGSVGQQSGLGQWAVLNGVHVQDFTNLAVGGVADRVLVGTDINGHELPLLPAAPLWIDPGSFQLNMSIGSGLAVSGTNLVVTLGAGGNIIASGEATLSAGTVTVTTTAANSTNRFALGYHSIDGSLSTYGYKSVVNGVSFVLFSGNVNDTNKISWQITKP